MKSLYHTMRGAWCKGVVCTGPGQSLLTDSCSGHCVWDCICGFVLACLCRFLWCVYVVFNGLVYQDLYGHAYADFYGSVYTHLYSSHTLMGAWHKGVVCMEPGQSVLTDSCS